MSAIGKIVSEEMTETEIEEANDSETKDSDVTENGKEDDIKTEKCEDDIKTLENGDAKKEKSQQNGDDDDIECVGEIEADTSKQNGQIKDDLNTTKESESKTISDSIFFENISQDEKDFYSEEGQKAEDIGEMSIQCTACWKQVNHHVKNDVNRHPMLGVPICRSCYNFYGEDEDWEKDEEGWDIYCRWCANGGDLICCDSCTNTFCKRCIQRNKGRSKVAEITSADKWECFSCRPSQIFDIRSLAFAIFKWKTTIQAIKQVRVKEEQDKKKAKRLSQGKLQKEKFMEEKKKLLEKIKASNLREKQKEKQLKAKAETKSKAEVVHNIREGNFVDEIIKESFDTLEIYSKRLMEEKKRWMRVGKTMDANNAANAVKTLRNIYKITQQNMVLLDTAIVEHYGDAFPEENIEKKLKIGGATQKTSASPKGKTSTPKKKKKKTEAKTSDCEIEEVVINGQPTFGLSDDEFDPSQLCSAELTTGETESNDGGESSSKPSPAKFQVNSSVSKPIKVSTNMFKKKSPAKRMKPPQPKKKKPDSDIEEITIDDSDDDDDKAEAGGSGEADDETGYESQSITPAKSKSEPPSKKRRRSSADSDGSLELF